ncbi:MAG: Fic family protein, partial [Lachnospiraceae bacterium]
FVEFLLTTIYDALREIVETEQVNGQVSEQVEKLLEVIDDKEYSTREMMELLGLKHRPSFRNNYLLPALELGYVEMTIPDKPNSSKQKYKKVKN